MSQQNTRLIVIAAVVIIVVGAGYWYYSTSMKPKPPTEMLVWAAIGEKALVESYIAPIMLEEYNCKIIVEEALVSEMLTKLKAEGDNPSFDVASLDSANIITAKNLGLLHKITVDDVPNLKEIPEGLLDPTQYSVPRTLSFVGLWYDYELFESKGWDPPDSWYDLWDPKFENRVVLPPGAGTWSWSLFQIINRLEGGDIETNWDPGFAKIKELLPNVHSFSPRSSNTMTLVERDEAWLGPFGLSYTVVAQGKGITMKPVFCKEGIEYSKGNVVITANAPNIDLAYKYVNLILSAGYQAEQYTTNSYGPINPNAIDLLTAEELKNYMFTEENIALSYPNAVETYAARKEEFMERWNTEIETK
ncbi:extracellular solute-binding protein [Thermoproteota archaeon]